ncbi:MAG: MarR family transcriptional regulator [Clostridiales bacterium]|nr:MarR family transcriptional regulator [Clostridiales bacterium]MDY3747970.1 MarR family transcriptional regulator [Lachnospiraceae bacterium]
MDEYGRLCILLNRVFDYHAGLEQKYVADSRFGDISVNDMHIIDAIGPDSAKNMSSVAKKVGVTVGTLTIAMNNLVKKGYVLRSRSEKDRRVVLVSLSEKGQAAYLHHQSFYGKMSRVLQKVLDEDKCSILNECLSEVLNSDIQ